MFARLIYIGKKMNDNFKKVDNFAKDVYLTFIKEKSPLSSEKELLSEFSQQAYQIAQTWFDLENERLQLFYSRDENRVDWKTPTDKNNALRYNDCNEYISPEHYGRYYWVTKHSDNTPVYAKFVDLDDGFYKFKDPKSNNIFLINSILISKVETT